MHCKPACSVTLSYSPASQAPMCFPLKLVCLVGLVRREKRHLPSIFLTCRGSTLHLHKCTTIILWWVITWPYRWCLRVILLNDSDHFDAKWLPFFFLVNYFGKQLLTFFCIRLNCFLLSFSLHPEPQNLKTIFPYWHVEGFYFNCWVVTFH